MAAPASVAALARSVLGTWGMNTHACSICSQPCPAGHGTCGLSECQEASYSANLAHTARKRDRARLYAIAAEKAETARRWSYQRHGVAS